MYPSSNALPPLNHGSYTSKSTHLNAQWWVLYSMSQLHMLSVLCPVSVNCLQELDLKLIVETFSIVNKVISLSKCFSFPSEDIHIQNHQLSQLYQQTKEISRGTRPAMLLLFWMVMYSKVVVTWLHPHIELLVRAYVIAETYWISLFFNPFPSAAFPEARALKHTLISVSFVPSPPCPAFVACNKKTGGNAW